MLYQSSEAHTYLWKMTFSKLISLWNKSYIQLVFRFKKVLGSRSLNFQQKWNVFKSSLNFSHQRFPDLILFTSECTKLDYLLFYKNRESKCPTLHKRRFFVIKDLFTKCDQIFGKLRIWSHLLKRFLMEIFIFCAVADVYYIYWRDF